MLTDLAKFTQALDMAKNAMKSGQSVNDVIQQTMSDSRLSTHDKERLIKAIQNAWIPGTPQPKAPAANIDISGAVTR